MNTNWKQKLSSRKFWLAVIAFITPILFSLKVSETAVENITNIIMSGSALIAYILAEGYVDANKQ